MRRRRRRRRRRRAFLAKENPGMPTPEAGEEEEHIVNAEMVVTNMHW